MVNFVGEAVDGGLEGLHLFFEAVALFDEDIAAGLVGAFLVKELDVFDEGLDPDAGAAHAFDEFYPLAGCFVEIPDAAGLAGHGRQKADAFVVAQGIGGYVIQFADFFDGHGAIPPCGVFFYQLYFIFIISAGAGFMSMRNENAKMG